MFQYGVCYHVGLFETPFILGHGVEVVVKLAIQTCDFAAHQHVTGSMGSSSNYRDFISGHSLIQYVLTLMSLFLSVLSIGVHFCPKGVHYFLCRSYFRRLCTIFCVVRTWGYG